MDPVTLALAGRRSKRDTRTRSLPRAVDHGVSLLAEPFDNPAVLTPSRCTLSADRENFVHGQQAVKMTPNPGVTTSMVIDRIYPTGQGVPLRGKYVRLWLHAADITAVSGVRIQLQMGDGNTSAFEHSYDLNLATVGGTLRVVEEFNQIDAHLSAFSTTGEVAGENRVSRVRVVISFYGGKNTEVTLDRLEFVQRRPYVCFVNDEPYKHFFTGGVHALLEERGLPYGVQFLKETAEAYLANPENPSVSTIEPLSVVRDAIQKGLLEPGLHLNCNVDHASDADFYQWQADHLSAMAALGLLRKDPHLAALTNHWGTLERKEFTERLGATSRAGSGWVSGVSKDIDRLHPIPPHPGIRGFSLPYVEFDHDTTEATARGWLQDAIENELGVYVFGHGAAEGTQHRSPLAVYEAFFDEYDANSEKLDWLSPSQLHERYYSAVDDLRVTEQTYWEPPARERPGGFRY